MAISRIRPATAFNVAWRGVSPDDLANEAAIRAAADAELQANIDAAIAEGDLNNEVARRELLTEPAVSELASMWSSIIVGEPKDRAGLPESGVAFDGADGLVIRVSGAGSRAPRAAYRMVPGHKYEVLAMVRRETDPHDTAGNNVNLRATWLSANKAGISTVNLESFAVLGLTLHLFRKVVSTVAGSEVDVVAAANTVYFTPSIQTLGTDGVTNILPYIRVTDLTSNTLISADVSGLDARLDAIESADLDTRLTAVETALSGSEIVRFKTRGAAAAATIPALVDMAETLSYATDGDGGGATYKKVGADPGHGGKFQSVDGAWWELVNAAVKPEMYGALGNGTTDDDAAMTGMAAQARARGFLNCSMLPGKIYTHKHPAFLASIPYIFIDGNGSAIRNIKGTSAADTDYITNYTGLVFGGCFVASNYNNYAGVNSDGELINTAAAGATTITVSDGSTAIVAGNRILIYGFDCQGTASFPPCARFFEYNTVVSKSGGVLTLKTPLRYPYDAAWPDNTLGGTPYGAARVIGLNRTDFAEIKSLHLRNLTVDRNPNWTTAAGLSESNGQMQIGGCKECLLENVTTVGGVYPTQAQHIRAVGCNFSSTVEVDKCLESFAADDTSFEHLAGGNGTRSVTLNNVRCSKDVFLNPLDVLEVNGGEFHASGSGGTPFLWGLNGPIRRATFNAVRHYVTGSSCTSLVGDLAFTVTVGSVSSGSFSITRTHYDAQRICAVLFEGAVLYDTVGAPAFRLTRLPYVSGSNVIFEGTFLKTIAAGNVLAHCYLNDVTVNHPIYDGPYGDQIRTLSLLVNDQLSHVKISDPQRGVGYCRFDQRDYVTDGNLRYFRPGGRLRPTKMTFNVERAYTGTSNPASVLIYPYGGTVFPVMQINLRTAGVRTIEKAGIFGLQTGDTLNAFGPDYFTFIAMYTFPAGFDMAGGPGSMPVWQCEIEGVRI